MFDEAIPGATRRCPALRVSSWLEPRREGAPSTRRGRFRGLAAYIAYVECVFGPGVGLQGSCLHALPPVVAQPDEFGMTAADPRRSIRAFSSRPLTILIQKLLRQLMAFEEVLVACVHGSRIDVIYRPI